MLDEEYISKKDGKYLIKREFEGIEYFFGEFLTIDEAILKKKWLNDHGWPVSKDILEKIESEELNNTASIIYDPLKFNCNADNISYKKDILSLVDNINFIKEDPKIPFPQANDLNRFIFLCQHLFKKDLTKEEIKKLNQIGNRNVNMYAGVGLYFKIFEKYSFEGKIVYSLNEKGKSIFKSDEYTQNMGICYCILEHEIFNEIFLDCLSKNEIKIDNIVNIMLKYDLNLNSMVTIKRRGSCVSNWMHWIFNLMNVVESKQTTLC